MITVNEAAALLSSFDHVLILTHVRPDGDTVGCAAALCQTLRQLGKTAFVLPNPELTDNLVPYFTPYEAPAEFTPERVVTVDIATLDLLPENARAYAGRIDLAIDHHPSFTGFGKACLVRPEAAACAEILYDVVLAMAPLTARAALALYVALSTDTGCFAYGNTTAHSHTVAAALMETGIDYQQVNKVFFRTKTRRRMQLEAAMLDRAEFYDEGRIAVLSVPLSLMARFCATESDAEDLSSLGPQIQGVDCAVTMRELQPGQWKFSLRTTPRVNASQICQLLGGGGHAAAAGCTVEAPWAQARNRMLQAIIQITGEAFPLPAEE